MRNVISIHALREEGDPPPRSAPGCRRISIHALREEGDPGSGPSMRCGFYFYPRPPRGGRLQFAVIKSWGKIFLSTPSARRATQRHSDGIALERISIHALREEGDGFPAKAALVSRDISIHALREEGDRTDGILHGTGRISIHALREEGDCLYGEWRIPEFAFLSTPSARRATRAGGRGTKGKQHFYPRPPRGGRQKAKIMAASILEISIHALREEGDQARSGHQVAQDISIHALREEGDRCSGDGCCRQFLFLSTPSARRATADEDHRGGVFLISIHALREEGDRFIIASTVSLSIFLSTPSARRATSRPRR